MNNQFYYVVVTIDGQNYYINRDMDYTDNFDDVLKFSEYADAEHHIENHLIGKQAKILHFE